MHVSQATNTQHAAETEHVLLHHFGDLEQQRQSATLGMWVFLITEIMFFGGLFAGYMIYRLAFFNAFAAGSNTLDLRLGAINTAVLIASSLTMALAVHAAQIGARKKTVLYLLGTIVLGLVFLGIKVVEYADKFEHHHVPGQYFEFQEPVSLAHGEQAQGEHAQSRIDPRHAELFFGFYFAMTGMHALHMIIGVGILAVLTFLAWRGRYGPQYHTPVHNVGLYWHFVDIVWIFLFPLLYLISRHG